MRNRRGPLDLPEGQILDHLRRSWFERRFTLQDEGSALDGNGGLYYIISIWWTSQTTATFSGRSCRCLVICSGLIVPLKGATRNWGSKISCKAAWHTEVRLLARAVFSYKLVAVRVGRISPVVLSHAISDCFLSLYAQINHMTCQELLEANVGR